MPTVRTGLNGKRFHLEQQTIALNGSGTGSAAVTFDVAYTNTPVVAVVPPLGVNGTFAAGSITTTGFTLSITTASDLASANCEVGWMAHEPL